MYNAMWVDVHTAGSAHTRYAKHGRAQGQTSPTTTTSQYYYKILRIHFLCADSELQVDRQCVEDHGYDEDADDEQILHECVR